MNSGFIHGINYYARGMDLRQKTVMIDRVKFRGRKQSARGIIAFIMGCVTVVALLVMVILNGVYNVSGGNVFGIIGIFSFAIAIAGFVIALMSMKERDIFLGIPIAAISLNGISVIVYFVLYILGLSV